MNNALAGMPEALLGLLPVSTTAAQNPISQPFDFKTLIASQCLVHKPPATAITGLEGAGPDAGVNPELALLLYQTPAAVTEPAKTGFDPASVTAPGGMDLPPGGRTLPLPVPTAETELGNDNDRAPVQESSHSRYGDMVSSPIQNHTVQTAVSIPETVSQPPIKTDTATNVSLTETVKFVYRQNAFQPGDSEPAEPDTGEDPLSVRPERHASVRHETATMQFLTSESGASSATVKPLHGHHFTDPGIAAFNVAGSHPPVAHSNIASSAELHLPQAHGEVDLTQDGYETQLARHVVVTLQKGQQQVRMLLHPPELGSVDIKLELNDKDVKLNLIAHTYAARESLDAAMPRLREIMNGNGMNLVDAQVSHHDSSRSDGFGSGTNGGHEHDHSNRSTAGMEEQGSLPAVTVHWSHSLLDVFA